MCNEVWFFLLPLIILLACSTFDSLYKGEK